MPIVSKLLLDEFCHSLSLSPVVRGAFLLGAGKGWAGRVERIWGVGEDSEEFPVCISEEEGSREGGQGEAFYYLILLRPTPERKLLGMIRGGEEWRLFCTVDCLWRSFRDEEDAREWMK